MVLTGAPNPGNPSVSPRPHSYSAAELLGAQYIPDSHQCLPTTELAAAAPQPPPCSRPHSAPLRPPEASIASTWLCVSHSPARTHVIAPPPWSQFEAPLPCLPHSAFPTHHRLSFPPSRSSLPTSPHLFLGASHCVSASSCVSLGDRPLRKPPAFQPGLLGRTPAQGPRRTLSIVGSVTHPRGVASSFTLLSLMPETILRTSHVRVSRPQVSHQASLTIPYRPQPSPSRGTSLRHQTLWGLHTGRRACSP